MGGNGTKISELMDRIEWLETDARELKVEILQLIVTSKAQRKTMAHQDIEIKYRTEKIRQQEADIIRLTLDNNRMAVGL